MLAIDRIPTKDFLVKRGVQIQPQDRGCPWCARELETSDHLCFKCNFIEGFWQKIFFWWELRWSLVVGFAEFFYPCNKVQLISITVASWIIWLARNESVFNRKLITMESLVFNAKMRALLWVRAAYDKLMVFESS